MRTWGASTVALSVQRDRLVQRRRVPRYLAPFLIAAALLIGVLAGALVIGGRVQVVFALSLVFVPVVLWYRPDFGPVALVGAAVVVEQFAYTVGTRDGVATSRIPLFEGFASGVHLNGVDALVALIAVITHLRQPPSVVRRSTPNLGRAFAFLLGAVALGVVVGLAHHGDSRTAFTEVRPYFYLFAAFALARRLATTDRLISAFLWAMVIGSGLKAVLGLALFAQVRHARPRPEAVLGHEEAFFFALFLVITAGLWLFGVKGRLRTCATALAPLVFLADLVNTRRTAWLVLGGGMAALMLVSAVSLPHRRRALKRIVVLAAMASAVYFPTYWHHTGAVAQPARALRAVSQPDQRDASSDLYRQQENANLRLNIEQGGLLGKGFGVPINYALPITDISSIDPLITHVPHNGVLYIIMRMGVVGATAFWSLVGFAIIAGCRLARSPNRLHGLVGAVATCAMVCYVLQGYNDQGFFFYRIALTVGSLIGLCEVCRSLDRVPTTVEASQAKMPE